MQQSSNYLINKNHGKKLLLALKITCIDKNFVIELLFMIISKKQNSKVVFLRVPASFSNFTEFSEKHLQWSLFSLTWNFPTKIISSLLSPGNVALFLLFRTTFLQTLSLGNCVTISWKIIGEFVDHLEFLVGQCFVFK